MGISVYNYDNMNKVKCGTESELDYKTNFLLENHYFYLNSDLWAGYSKGYSDDIVLITDRIDISNYKYLSKSKIKKLIKWIRYNPYGHSKNLIDAVDYLFFKYSDFRNKIMYWDIAFGKIDKPLTKLLIFLLEEWIIEVIYDKDDYITFSMVAFEVSLFISSNKNLF